ncbi:MAG: FAD-dependent monooxygenase [Chloroflexi bacterium]|nr:FAD-dependent monooxygenase [Chloroflexota bacterium]
MTSGIIRRVLIVGGGPAGMTAGIALGCLGIESVILDLEDASRPVGIGVALQNSPLRALHELGLADACVERGYVHESVNVCSPDGEVVFQIETPPLVPGEPSLMALSRMALAEILDDALGRVPQAEVRFGTTVEALRDRGEQVEATLSDGTVERFDLVVGADGLHSKVRELVMPDAPAPQRARQVIWRASVSRPPQVDRYYIYDLGPVGRVGLVPISDAELYLWKLEPDAGLPRPAPDRIVDVLRERLASFRGLVPLAAEHIRPNVDYRHLSALLVPPPWYRGRVLLIGDAAHTTTPHIAYGVGMAIEDSVVLAEVLTHASSIEEALDGFMARRWDRCKLVVETSLQLSEWEVEPPSDPAQPQRLTGRALAALSAPL